MKKENFAIALAVVAFIAAIIGLFGGGQKFGQITDTSEFDFFNAASGGGFQGAGVTYLTAAGSTTPVRLKVGQTGQPITLLETGTCHLFTGADGALTTFSASTTLSLDCQATSPKLGTAPAALSDVAANDIVILHAPTTTPVTGARPSFHILGYSASTTAGYISAVLANVSGADFTLASSSIRNWQYFVVRTP